MAKQPETLTIRQITDYLESVAPLSLQEDYDNSGLLIGDKDSGVRNALITLDVTPEVVKEAVDRECGLIVAHHPLIFRGLKSITGKTYVEQATIAAIKNDIAIYAIHTNLDNVLHEGVNGEIARRIGLQDIKVLSPLANLNSSERGAGVVGDLTHVMTEEEFFRHLRTAMALKTFRHTPLLGRRVKRVAVCGGSGSFLLSQAIRSGAQCYISADFKYHDFFDAEGQIVIADIGHYESERFTMDLLQSLICSKFPNFAAHLTKTVTNPINYYPR